MNSNIVYYMRRLRSLVSIKNFVGRFRFRSCGKHLQLGRNTRMVNPNFVSVGDNFIIDEFAELHCTPPVTPKSLHH